MQIRLPLLILFVIVSTLISAQQLEHQVSFLRGNFLSHTDKRPEKNSMHNSISYTLSKPSMGSKYWQYAHNYPTMGINVTFTSLGNYAVYGYALSVIPLLEFDVYNYKKGKITIRHGTGLALFSNKHNEVRNPNNYIIGSNLNASSTLQATVDYNINNSMQLCTGLALHHYSNGGIILPNAGVNTLSFFTSIKWKHHSNAHTKIVHQPMTQLKRWNYRIGTSLGIYGYDKYTKMMQTNWQVNGMVFYQHNTRFRTGIGIEKGFLTHTYFKSPTSIYVEEEVQFARMTTKYGFGMYVHNLLHPGERFYSKIGINYYPKVISYIPKGWHIGTALKAHNFAAAHIELSLGYIF